jgi:hypothetical protein
VSLDAKEARDTRNQLESCRTKLKTPNYLFPAAFAAFKVGCCIESFIRRFFGPPIWDPTCLALQSETMLRTAPPPVRFDSDSYLIGVDNHTSKCMANAPHLFEDLHLNNNKGHVDGINSGLDIAGQGIFKFNITNGDGKIHAIKIPNSLYIPNLKRCLLLPQHWAQEAGDDQTWMGNYRDSCVLNWRKGKKTVPFQPMTNMPGVLHGFFLQKLFRFCCNL